MTARRGTGHQAVYDVTLSLEDIRGLLESLTFSREATARRVSAMDGSSSTRRARAARQVEQWGDLSNALQDVIRGRV